MLIYSLCRVLYSTYQLPALMALSSSSTTYQLAYELVCLALRYIIDTDKSQAQAPVA